MLCPHCEYELRGTPGEKCPECGQTSTLDQRTNAQIKFSNWSFTALAVNLMLLFVSILFVLVAIANLIMNRQFDSDLFWSIALALTAAGGAVTCFVTAHRRGASLRVDEPFRVHPGVWLLVWMGPIGLAAFSLWVLVT